MHEGYRSTESAKHERQPLSQSPIEYYMDPDRIHHGLIPATPEIVAFELAKLEVVTQTLAGFDCIIEGGIAADLRASNGSITRAHADFDIGVFEDKFDELVEHLRVIGWNVFNKTPEQEEEEGAHQLEATNMERTEDGRYFSLIDTDEPIPSVYMGFHVRRRAINPEGIVMGITSDTGVMLPLSWYYEEGGKELKRGLFTGEHTLALAPPEEIIAFKARTGREKDFFDAQSVAPLVTPAEWPRVRETAHSIFDCQLREVLLEVYNSAVASNYVQPNFIQAFMGNHTIRSAYRTVPRENMDSMVESASVHESFVDEDVFLDIALQAFQPLTESVQRKGETPRSKLRGIKTKRETISTDPCAITCNPFALVILRNVGYSSHFLDVIPY